MDNKGQQQDIAEARRLVAGFLTFTFVILRELAQLHEAVEEERAERAPRDEREKVRFVTNSRKRYRRMLDEIKPQLKLAMNKSKRIKKSRDQKKKKQPQGKDSDSDSSGEDVDLSEFLDDFKSDDDDENDRNGSPDAGAGAKPGASQCEVK